MELLCDTYVLTEPAMYRKFLKRALDTVIAVLVCLVLSPVFLLTALAVYIEDHGPVLYRQPRLGLHGRTFTIYKFRSMRINSEHTGSGVYSEKGDPRVTRTGRLIRACSIDELPQMLNVVKGDMALIGPRPPLTYHPWPLEQYTEEQRHMFDVRPGLTGWAQVNGRKGVEWNERIRLNCWYAEHLSFPLDLKIVCKTVAVVLRPRDNVNTGATVAEPKPQEGANE